MEVADYRAYVMDLESRLKTLQTEYLADQDNNAQLIGPLLAITMLVKNDSLPFAQERYQAIVNGPQWKIAEDHVLSLRDEVEFMLAGPVNFMNRQAG